MAEDDLNAVNGLAWAGAGWRFSRVVEIQDSLVNTPVGRIVLDRHGVDNSVNDGISDLIFNSPFSAPEPGIFVVISMWGSKIEGCFAEVIIQVAPVGQWQADAFIPTALEMGIGEQIVSLPAHAATPARYGTTPYVYTENVGSLLGPSQYVQREGTIYTGRHVFAIDSTMANLLSNAPEEEVKARITYSDGSSTVFPIGEKTVKRWRDVYAFNPYCVDPNALQSAPTQPAPTQSAPAQPAPTQSAPAPQSAPPPNTDNQADASASQVAAVSPVASDSPPPPANAPVTRGETTLVATQTLNNVQFHLNGANVQSSSSFIIDFTVGQFKSEVHQCLIC